MLFKEVGMSMEEDSTREARRVPEAKNSAEQKKKSNNLSTAIQALTEVLREGERDNEINEKGRKCLQDALRAAAQIFSGLPLWCRTLTVTSGRQLGQVE
ncbi:hypothetical protein EMCG_02904 [[Emmonsia] crescens]|uniref:Uncharacterized protein n=1 Tax=[Emmonsia] crescens TaxID=73230 RepID=A0A0G2HWU1_9EURO|nr:hypothetical protein EMCG_02904 [Emmonsia crescens UAMH 3008]